MNHCVVRVVRFAFAAALLVAFGAATAQSRLPSRLSDAEFWFLSYTLSEPDGFFQSENYVSNEQDMQAVIPRFASRNSFMPAGFGRPIPERQQS